ncbi:MAG: hypothetical protein KY466_01950, partial [Gemmatimonadetes bacterium]|nr:hypothetical protein [Gemmatimonadota bacterium]
LRESASDLLVQNCDEYFSYSALTGLTRAGEEETVSAVNPWDLAERAVGQMANDNDVMRSDRLKQVMLELDPSFDEAQLGYSKFNRFLTEAASKNKLALKKLENGQYEVQPLVGGAEAESVREREESRRGRGRREPRREPVRREEPAREAQRPRQPKAATPEPQKPTPRPATRERKAEDLQHGYDLLRRAISDIIAGGDQTAARDSDIKRRMLELEAGWDEAEIGFTKFSRFLRQAHDAEVIDLQKSGEGYYEARVPGGAHPSTAESRPRAREEQGEERGGRDRDRSRRGGRDRDRDRGGRAAAAAGAREEADLGEEAEDLPQPESSAPSGREERPRRERTPRQEPVRHREPEPEEVMADGNRAEPDVMVDGNRAEPEAPKGEEAAAASREEKREAPPSTPRGFGRGGTRGRRGAPEGPPPLLPGQAVGASSSATGDGGAGVSHGEGAISAAPVAEPDAGVKSEESAARTGEPAAEPEGRPADEAVEAPAVRPEGAVARPAPGAGAEFDATELGLPTDSGSVIRYLSNSYPGVGQKTAETLISAFGADRVFHGLHADHEKVRDILGSGRRTEALIEAWLKDYRRRTTAGAAGSPAGSEGDRGA